MAASQENRAIFVTGGASGIGRAVAIFFAQRGWYVGIADIDQSGMAETLAMIGNDRSWSYTLDVRDRTQWDKALSEFAGANGGRIVVVFNNAGIGVGGPITDHEEEELEAMLDINLKGVIHGARAAHGYLKASGPGSVLLNTASVAGIIGPPGLAAYAATKWGVRGLTEALDAEWSDDRIRVASLCPGFIDTAIIGNTREGSNQTVKEELLEAGVEVNPVEIVPEVVWRAVHGKDLHYTVGKMAGRMRWLRRWLPGVLQNQLRKEGVGVNLEGI